MPSSRRAKAPKVVSLVMVTCTSSPTWYVLVTVSHGSGCSALQAQGNALLLAVNVHDEDIDLVANLQHIAGMRHRLPRQLGQVDQTIGAAQVDKGAEIGQATDPAVAYIALLQLS